jgi:hypothetical protein
MVQDSWTGGYLDKLKDYTFRTVIQTGFHLAIDSEPLSVQKTVKYLDA